MAIDTRPAPPVQAPRQMSEIDALRAQVAALTERLDDVSGIRRRKKEKPVYAKKPWEEVIWVEALRRGYHPEVGDTYGICRNGPRDSTDQRGNPIKTRGDIFRIMHREHLSSWMREVNPNDPSLPQAPEPWVPQTTARNQRVFNTPH